MDKISEQILQAIDILITKRMRELQFDKTIVCQIHKIINMDEGAYQVSYMDSIFTAYSLFKEKIYSIGDYVYVKIPCNNFNSKKIIEGLY